MAMRKLALPFELKAAPAEDGTFEGYGSVFGVKDWYGDVVEPGAFALSLQAWAAKGKTPAMLWQHDPKKPIGKWTRLAEDAKGLYVKGELALKTRDGADSYEHLKAGTVTGLSIGYDIPKGGGEWDPIAEVYRLKQLDLWEVSPVTFPANEAAGIESVKAAAMTTRELERFLRDAGLSARDAKALMSGGVKALEQRDAADEELEALKAQIRSNTRLLQTQGG